MKDVQNEKRILLQLLEDRDICQKVMEICSGKTKEDNSNAQGILAHYKCLEVGNPEDFKGEIQSSESVKVALEQGDGKLQDELLEYKKRSHDLEQCYLLQKQENEQLRFELRKIEQVLNDSQEENRNVLQNKEIEYRDIQTKYDKEKQDYKAKIEACHKKIDYYEVQYKELEDIMSQYEQLSDVSKNSLENIFRSRRIDEFLACGVQLSNIEEIWNYARAEIQEGRLEEIDILNQLIVYFMKLYNCTKSCLMYEAIQIKEEMDFDLDYCIRASDSLKASGKISKIYLKGFYNRNTEQIWKKAIVKVI